MITRELLDSIDEGFFDEDLLHPVNSNIDLLDAGIDEEIEAGESLFETTSFDSVLDSLIYEEEE